MNNDVMYSSKRDDWRTPEEILDLVRRFCDVFRGKGILGTKE